MTMPAKRIQHPIRQQSQIKRPQQRQRTAHPQFGKARPSQHDTLLQYLLRQRIDALPLRLCRKGAITDAYTFSLKLALAAFSAFSALAFSCDVFFPAKTT